MNAFISDEDQITSRRLGISYPEAPCKPLISWGLSVEDHARLLRDGLDGQFNIEELDGRFSRLVLFPGDSTATRSWDFQDGMVVSSILHRTREWKQIDSPHFRFFISDTALFHPANIEALESFLTDTASLLGMSDADLDRLSREKIYYCFCSSQEEIRELTGYVARGMYVVSHDIIVSTYSAHFHELAHLLMNYKLQRPHLYTHPLFLEGFAVAVGGRGGRSPDIMHQLGLSIHREGWVSLEELLDAQGFYSLNASMSYPGSAPFNRFLLEELESTDYLVLYERYGGDAPSVMRMKIDQAELPTEKSWRKYLEEQPAEGAIGPGAVGLETRSGPVAFHPLSDGAHFGFAVFGTTLAIAGPPSAEYRSFLYEDFFENAPYAGQRYLIRASAGEVGVYDLFTNTMIAHYASGFSDDLSEIPVVDGRFLFHVDRSVFPDDLGAVECRFIE
ncbi:MAG: hypothetical protein ABFS42_07590 [Candidatus Krumholzibacteriota bacterium]